MRAIRILACAVGMGLAAVGCANILGDFQVGGGDAGDSGGGDAPVVDDAGDAGDAGPDAAGLKPYVCNTNGGMTTISFVQSNAPVSDGDRVHLKMLPGGNKWRATLEHYDTLYYVDFPNNQNQNVTWNTFSFGQQLLASAEYQAPNNQTGIAYLTFDFGSSKLNAWLFADGESGPRSTPVTLDVLTGLGTSPSIKGTLDVVDPNVSDFIFVVQYSANGTTPFDLLAGHYAGGSTKTVTLGQNNGGGDAPAYSIVHDPQHAFVFWPPDSVNNTPSGPANLYIIDVLSWSLTTTRPLKPSSGFYLPFAVARSSTQGAVDVGMLQGDLSQQQTPPVLITGTVTDPNLGTFDPSTLSTGTTLDLAHLPVNKGVAHWVTFNGEDEFVAAGRPIQTSNGINAVWADSLGRLRWEVSASNDGGGGLPNGLVNAVDFTFAGPPQAGLANMTLIWTDGQGDQNAPATHVMPMICTPQ